MNSGSIEAEEVLCVLLEVEMGAAVDWTDDCPGTCRTFDFRPALREEFFSWFEKLMN